MNFSMQLPPPHTARPPRRAGPLLKASGLGLAALVALALTGPARATEALTFTDNGQILTSSGVTIGYTFVPTADITVTDLGAYFVPGVTPARTPGTIPVGLWDSAGTLIASTTVAAPATLPDDTYTYASITSQLLTAGDTYTVGGYYGSDSYSGISTYMPAAQISDVQFTYASGSPVLMDPTNPNSPQTGASFEFTPAASPAPEPSQVGMLALLGLSLGGLLLRARRKAAGA